ncbi:hypothetical protein [Actinoplanes awajinensis]|uniref:hypothetical protein n=1 Tax=Actinoplanes awajinensis TaxID=135946 RepID=UPI001E48767E|nr:hypothetical protein [Actinoplanes awajinensis]
MSPIKPGGMSATSRGQDAVRILLIISAAATPIAPTVSDHVGDPAANDLAPADAVAVLESQVLLQKLDFWVRNPDFLADELLNDYEQGGDAELLELAGSILESDEPEVRRYPMMRFLFGAYEPLDDALAVLRSAHLVVRRKRGTVDGRVRRHDYYLTRTGRSAAERIVHDVPEFGYFVDRTLLVARLATGYGGSRLKARQYQQDEYRHAVIGDQIATIAPRVQQRWRRCAAERQPSSVDAA